MPSATRLRGFLADNDVDSSGVREIDGPATGVALIQVADGDNAITVASGANLHFTKAMVRHAPRDDEVWVAQFETPIATTEADAEAARAPPAPARCSTSRRSRPSRPLAEVVDVAVLNEIELRRRPARKLQGRERRAHDRRRLPEAARARAHARSSRPSARAAPSW